MTEQDGGAAFAESVQRLKDEVSSPGGGEIGVCDEILREVRSLHHPQAIVALAPLLRDDADDPQLMYLILHTVEDDADGLYVERLAGAASALLEHAPDWAATLFARVLNSETAASRLRLAAQHVDDRSLAAATEILHAVKEEVPELAHKVNAVIASW